MITRIGWKYPSFPAHTRERSMELGAVTVFTGANASGKTTALNAVRLLIDGDGLPDADAAAWLSADVGARHVGIANKRRSIDGIQMPVKVHKEALAELFGARSRWRYAEHMASPKTAGAQLAAIFRDRARVVEYTVEPRHRAAFGALSLPVSCDPEALAGAIKAATERFQGADSLARNALARLNNAAPVVDAPLRSVAELEAKRATLQQRQAELTATHRAEQRQYQEHVAQRTDIERAIVQTRARLEEYRQHLARAEADLAAHPEVTGEALAGAEAEAQRATLAVRDAVQAKAAIEARLAMAEKGARRFRAILADLGLQPEAYGTSRQVIVEVLRAAGRDDLADLAEALMPAPIDAAEVEATRELLADKDRQVTRANAAQVRAFDAQRKVREQQAAHDRAVAALDNTRALPVGSVEEALGELQAQLAALASFSPPSGAAHNETMAQLAASLRQVEQDLRTANMAQTAAAALAAADADRASAVAARDEWKVHLAALRDFQDRILSDGTRDLVAQINATFTRILPSLSVELHQQNGEVRYRVLRPGGVVAPDELAHSYETVFTVALQVAYMASLPGYGAVIVDDIEHLDPELRDRMIGVLLDAVDAGSINQVFLAFRDDGWRPSSPRADVWRF